MTEHGVLRRKGNWYVVDTDGGDTRRAAKVDELPAGLAEGDRVSFEWSRGEAKGLRAEGQAVVRAAAVNQFLNPYAFVPLAPRAVAPPELGDHAPVGHHQIQPDRWTGTLTVTMRTITPLLALEPVSSTRGGDRDKDEHKVFKPAERDNRPYVAATSVKGMLRASFEAITNSRFGIFPTGEEEGGGHQFRLAYRMTTQESLRLVPARVTEDGTKLELLGGTNVPGRITRSDPQYAAWLPYYRNPLRSANPELLKHGTKVTAGLVSVQHGKGFRYWQVKELAEPDGRITAKVDKVVTGWVCVTGQNIKRKHDERVFFADSPRCSAEVEITDEMRASWDAVIRSYRAAHDTEREIWGRKEAPNEPSKYIGHKPGQTAWSRHLWEPRPDEEARKLHAGDLVFAELDNAGQPVFLSPVMIGRRPFDHSPYDLLPRDHRPAPSWTDLSPADRVFGWVRPSSTKPGPAAYRGQLHVGPVVSEHSSADAIERFGRKVPLAILGTPKPTQARFYVHDSGTSTSPAKGDWYKSQHQQLGGRKFYVHHAGLDPRHWSPAPESDRDPTQEALNGRYREYLRGQKAVLDSDNDTLPADGKQHYATQGDPVEDSQNRSILGWVKPDTTFTFEIGLRNLNDLEVGALLWLLGERAGPEDRPFHHRLGYGKPLGFGSVQIRIDHERSRLYRGEAWGSYWSDLTGGEEPDQPVPAAELKRLEEAFDQAATEAWPDVIKAFLAIGAGDDHYPVHYPRVRPDWYDKATPVAPDPQGKAYEWFVENERTGAEAVSDAHRRQALKPGLNPLTVHTPQPRRSGPQGPPRRPGPGGGFKGGRRGGGGPRPRQG